MTSYRTDFWCVNPIIVTRLFYLKMLSIKNVKRIMEEKQDAVDHYQRVNILFHENIKYRLDMPTAGRGTTWLNSRKHYLILNQALDDCKYTFRIIIVSVV